MKKVLGIIAVTAIVASSAFAQGTMAFVNNASTLVRLEDGTPVPVGAGRVQLAWAALGTAYTPWANSFNAQSWLAANPGWTLIGTPAQVGFGLAGRFSAGAVTANTAAPGAVVQVVVVGWNNTATSFLEGYASALATGNGQVGASPSPFQIDTGDPTTVPAGTATSIAGIFPGLTLQAIPEPSSFALAGLGAAALMIFRRRK